MNTYFRVPSVRLAVAAVLLVALASLYLFTGVFRGGDPEPLESSAEVPASPDVQQAGAFQDAAAPSGPSGLDALGAPDDPLPASFPLPAIDGLLQGGDAVDTLARQVLAGGSDSLPALITAIQASGIGIIGPGDSVDAKPAEPWQGMTMQRWEVRTAAVMVLPERAVTFALADLAGVLVAVVPELKDAPLEQLIVKDVRALAESQIPTKRFLGHFIAALGRNATSHAPYDLLADGDPQTIRVDGLQASLIVRRLATDFLMLTGDKNDRVDKKTAAFLHTLRGWIEPTVHAQSRPPCTLDDRTRTIVDLAGLGSQLAFGGIQVGDLGMRGIIEYLEGHGFRNARNFGTISAIASTLLGYAQLIAAYAGLEVEVTMDRTPLVRTKKPSPQTGERRELTAVVKMNLGNAQMLNCFRTLLIAVGLDFSLPNDGPVKGAHVSWYGVEGFNQAAPALQGGPQAIVQFVAPESSRIQGGGDASSGLNPITNAVTGDDGKVQIGVEGSGQHENISNDATEVRKSAKLRLHIALKGADLFGDLQEAAGTAVGLGTPAGLAAVPLSILSRSQWASVGQYTFPVTDWREGPPDWTGTITYTKTTTWNESQKSEAAHLVHDYSEVLTLNVTITEALHVEAAFTDAGEMQGTAHANYTMRNSRSGGQLTLCGGRVLTDVTYTQLDTGEGTGSGTARARVGISADGQYSITLYPEVSLTTRTSYTTQQMVRGRECRYENQSHGSPERTGSAPISINIQGDGRIDPRMPDRLTGRAEEKEGRTTYALTWDLQRN